MSEIATTYCPECRRRWHTFDPQGACPYCSTEVARSFVTEVIDSQSGLIGADVACIECAYNLRMQPAGGRCPECGTAIAESLVRGRLIFMPLNWLRRVSVGIRGTFIALVIAAMGLLLIFAMFYAMITPTGFGLSMVAVIAIYLIYIVLTPVIWVFGAWRATTPDPTNAPEWRHLHSRLIWTRWLMLASVTMLLFLILVVVLTLFGNPASGDPFEFISCIAFIIPPTFLVSCLLYVTILRAYMVQQKRVWLRRMLLAWAWLIGVGIAMYASMLLLFWLPASLGYDRHEAWYYDEWRFEFMRFVTTFSWVLHVVSLAVGLYSTFGAWHQFRSMARIRAAIETR